MAGEVPLHDYSKLFIYLILCQRQHPANFSFERKPRGGTYHLISSLIENKAIELRHRKYCASFKLRQQNKGRGFQS